MAEWRSIEISTEPLIERVQPAIDAITAVLDYLIAILSIAQAILNIIKAFLVGFLDPIRAIVELIISTIQQIIADLRQLGLYFAGDWALIRSEDKFSSLLGGYAAYERRMISRLVDTSDPGRPDFSSASVTLGVFFYVSSGDISIIIRLIRAILRFFGNSDLLGNSMPYGTPTTPEIKYGTDGAGIASFRQLGSLDEVPGAMTVSWAMPQGTGGLGQAFTPAPKGFLLHISTIPDGFRVIGSVAIPTTAEVENVPRTIVAGVDPLTNGPLKLYGGIADLETGSEDFSDVEHDNEQAPQLFLQQDTNTPLIRPSTLLQGGRPLIANTFYVKTGFVSKLGGGTTFSATILKDDLPLHASFKAGSDGYAEVDGDAVEATKYWVRVRAITQDYVTELLPGVAAPMRAPADLYAANVPRPYWIPANSIIQATDGVLLPFGPSSVSPDAGWVSMTPASGAAIAEFPSEVQVNYKRAVQAAIALAILCRADLTEGNAGQTLGVVGPEGSFKYGTYAPGQGLLGLESAGRDLMARYGVTKTFFRGRRPQRFRMKLRNLLIRVATDLNSRGPVPPTVAQALETQAQTLLEFTWDEIDSSLPGITILQSVGLEPSELEEDKGVGGNPYCRMYSKKVLDIMYENGQGPTRTPAFSVKEGVLATEWIPGGGSADYSPILFNDETGLVLYARNAVSAHDSGALLAAAVTILQLASSWTSRPIGDAGWTALRLMPQALAPLDELLERLDRFLQGVLDGLEGITDKIIAYIEAIQARIYQLQALLVKIRAIINSLDAFRIGPASALVLLENGTDGLVSGLVSAENKPADSATAYGAGVVVVAGGLPSVLLELLRVVFSGGDD